jgi:FMN phosphatase YigB (HAD superfamily)/ASC-1-like (ASCH) protein
LAQILSGRKTVEVRVGYDNILRLKPGDRIAFNDQHRATLQRTARYRDFEELLSHENPCAIAPNASPEDLLDMLRQIYPPEKEALGAVALEVKLDRRYEILLFDVGYTLVYFEPSQELIVQQALHTLGIDRSVDEISAAARVVWGMYYQHAETDTFPATQDHDRRTQAKLEMALLAQLQVEPTEDALEVYSTAVESRFGQPNVIRPYPEVAEVLTLLCRQGYRLGIVSNWSWNLRDRLAQAGLDHFFEVIWASAYAGCNKPHPGIFASALSEMTPPATPSNRVLYVGDSYDHDVIGARNAAIDAALLDRDGTATSADCPIIRDLWGVFDLVSVKE